MLPSAGEFGKGRLPARNGPGANQHSFSPNGAAAQSPRLPPRGNLGLVAAIPLGLIACERNSISSSAHAIAPSEDPKLIQPRTPGGWREAATLGQRGGRTFGHHPSR